MVQYRSFALAAGALAICLTGSPSRSLAQESAAAASGWNGDGGMKPAYSFMRRAWGRMTPDDRAALFDAHLSALRVGLKLTGDQEKLWPALEGALRDAAKEIVEHRRDMMTEGPPADPVAGLRRMADRMNATGTALRRIADAAQPLYATLGEDQKRRLPILLHGLGPGPLMMRAHLRRTEDMRDSPQADGPIGWGLPQ